MPCTPFNVPGVGTGIVCTRGKPKRCKCGAVATRLCDWKVPGKKSGTCDEPLCANCASEPAPGKDLCPTHAAEWKERLERRAVAREGAQNQQEKETR